MATAIEGLLAEGEGSAPALHGLFDPVDQFPGWHSETMCNSHQQGERWLAFATFKLAVVRTIHIGHHCKCVLGNLLLLTLLAHDLAEGQGDGRVE